jgi:hypothetical protein
MRSAWLSPFIQAIRLTFTLSMRASRVPTGNSRLQDSEVDGSSARERFSIVIELYRTLREETQLFDIDILSLLVLSFCK